MADTEIKKDSNIEDAEAKARFRRLAEYSVGIKLDEDDMIKLRLDQERRADQLQAEKKAQESPTAKPKEKMGLIFFLTALFLSIVGDLIDFFTGGTIGWFVGLFIDAILALMFGLSKSGRKQFKRMAIALVGESIPIIDMLPLRTIFLIWSYIKSRSKIIENIDSAAHKIT